MSLDLTNINVKYGTQTIIHDLSLSVKPGQGLLLSGNNGSGKTTLLHTIAGLRPYSGTMNTAKKISYISAQHPFDEKLSAQDNLEHILFINNIKYNKQYTDKYINFKKDKPVALLSSGQKKRLQLASCLSHDHSLWLIDEAHAHLDGEARQQLKKDIHKHLHAHNGIVCLVSHETNFKKLDKNWIEVSLS